MMARDVSFFDHTADMGIRIAATSREELVVGAIEGLYRAIGRLEGEGEARQVSYELRGEDDAGLLRDLLTEVLFLFELEKRILVEPRVGAFRNGRLVVGGKSLRVDAARSEFHREVKAITYHELAVRQVVDGWEATVIVDI